MRANAEHQAERIARRFFSAENPAEADRLLLLRSFDKLRWAIDCSPAYIEEYVLFATYAVKKIFG